MKNTTLQQNVKPLDETTYQNHVKRLRQDGWHLRSIPKEYRTEELCRIAVEHASIKLTNSATILYHVPWQYRTAEICELAVKLDGASLRWVPEEVMTYEMCYDAMTTPGNGHELDCVPQKFRDEKMCRAALTDFGELSSVPKELITKELCWLAIRTNKWAIIDVPEQYRTKEMFVYMYRRYEDPVIRDYFSDDVKTSVAS